MPGERNYTPIRSARSKESVAKVCIRIPNPRVHVLTIHSTFHLLSTRTSDSKTGNAMERLVGRSRIGSRLRNNHISGIGQETDR